MKRMTKMTKASWEEVAKEKLAGKKIVNVRWMTDEEVEHMGWYSAAPVIVLDDGNLLFCSRDDEGNDAGALFTTYKDLEVLPVI